MSSSETVGAHDFRNHFGWYIQRAAAGESFDVTRRGRPFARLTPPTPQLSLAEGTGAIRLPLRTEEDLVAEAGSVSRVREAV